MKLKNLLFGRMYKRECYKNLLTETDRKLLNRLMVEFEKLFAEREIYPTVTRLLRMDDVILNFLVVRRFEDSLREQGVFALDKNGEPNMSSGANWAVEVAAKARERLRKALKEFEDGLPDRAPAPKTIRGLADDLMPIASEQSHDSDVA